MTTEDAMRAMSEVNKFKKEWERIRDLGIVGYVETTESEG